MFGNIENYFDVEYDFLKLNLYSKTNFKKFVAQTTTQYGDEKNIPEWLVGFSVNESVNIVNKLNNIANITKSFLFIYSLLFCFVNCMLREANILSSHMNKHSNNSQYSEYPKFFGLKICALCSIPVN